MRIVWCFAAFAAAAAASDGIVENDDRNLLVRKAIPWNGTTPLQYRNDRYGTLTWFFLLSFFAAWSPRF